MDQNIVMWGEKSADARLLPPFKVTAQLEDKRVTVDGSLNPNAIKFELENVAMDESLESFFKKYGKKGDNSDEIVVDGDNLTIRDYMPFMFQKVFESIFETVIKNQESARHIDLPEAK